MSEQTEPAKNPPGVSVTRSQEQLTVSTVWTPTGRVRISKRLHTVTETRTFELIREELVIEELDPVSSEPQLQVPGTEPVTLILRREQLEVTKRLVPYERVVMQKDLITEHHTINETLRKEQIEIADDTGALTAAEHHPPLATPSSEGVPDV